MRKSLLLLVALLSLVVIQACTEKLAEDVYFKQGYDLYNSGKFAEAITNFESIINYYPEGPNAPKALFMMGFIYSNHLNDLEKAKKYYQEFMDKYPEHELASSAQYELETMGKDINDLDIFKKADSSQAAEAKEAKSE